MYSNFLLTHRYVIIKVITAVAVTDTINVTIDATAATAPQSDSDPSDSVYI